MINLCKMLNPCYYVDGRHASLFYLTIFHVLGLYTLLLLLKLQKNPTSYSSQILDFLCWLYNRRSYMTKLFSQKNNKINNTNWSLLFHCLFVPIVDTLHHYHSVQCKRHEEVQKHCKNVIQCNTILYRSPLSVLIHPPWLIWSDISDKNGYIQVLRYWVEKLCWYKERDSKNKGSRREYSWPTNLVHLSLPLLSWIILLK